MVVQPAQVMLKDLKQRRGQGCGGKSCRHDRQAVEIMRNRLGRRETPKYLKAAQVSGLRKTLDNCLQAAKQKLSARCAFAKSLADLFKC
jgi:hypothetical protein